MVKPDGLAKSLMGPTLCELNLMLAGCGFGLARRTDAV